MSSIGLSNGTISGDAASTSSFSIETAQEEKAGEMETTDNNLKDEAATTAIPSYGKLARFIGTTILIWLSEPLLSLVDTTVVAWTQREHAVVQLASLGPATTLCDSLLYSTYFLAISTTNQIAAALATKDTNKLLKTTSQVLGVAIVLGVICTAVVFGAGAPLLTRMAGKSASPELLYHATRYTYIRGAACIASCLNMVCQSFCLANLNTRTPFQAVVAASIINIVGDLLLSPHFGVQGAALATAASNVASMTILLRAVFQQWNTWKQQLPKEEQPQTTSESAAATSPVSASSEQDRKFISLPNGTDVMNLLKLAGPISFVIWAKVACYGAMTLRSTDFGVIPLATHSIMMRIFFFFSSMGDSVSQAAQSFVPSTLYPTPQRTNFQKVFCKLLVIAGIIGVVNSQVSVLILQYMGQYLTSDANIIQLMKEQSTNFGLALLLHPIIMILEGTVSSSRDFVTLVASYAVTLCMHFGALNLANSFPAVWRTFLLFQGIRFTNFAARVWKGQRDMRRADKQTNDAKRESLAIA